MEVWKIPVAFEAAQDEEGSDLGNLHYGWQEKIFILNNFIFWD